MKSGYHDGVVERPMKSTENAVSYRENFGTSPIIIPVKEYSQNGYLLKLSVSHMFSLSLAVFFIWL